MQLTEDKNTARYLVKRYVPGEIHIDNDVYTHSIILSPNEILAWEAEDFESITDKCLLAILQLNPELVILGTGEVQRFPNKDILKPLTEKKIGLEIMDTHAACRTYNLLASEGRHIVAALLIK